MLFFELGRQKKIVCYHLEEPKQFGFRSCVRYVGARLGAFGRS